MNKLIFFFYIKILKNMISFIKENKLDQKTKKNKIKFIITIL